MPGSDEGSATPARPGFVYAKRDAQGGFVHDDESEQARIRALRLPPAWTDVQVSIDPRAKLQAIGRDKKGRTQYRYSDKHSEEAAADKFARIKRFVAKLPELRERIAASDSDEAAVLRLIYETGIRIGSDTDTGADKKAYGASTLLSEHVVTEGDRTFLAFVGKKGVDIRQEIVHPALAADLRDRASRGGRLFNTTDARVRDYLHSLSPGYKVKDFRTAVATHDATEAMKQTPAPANAREYAKAIVAVAKIVSQKLANTPTVALKSYIPPEVFSPWRIRVANHEQADLVARYAAEKGLDVDAAAREWIAQYARQFRADFAARFAGNTKPKGPRASEYGIAGPGGNSELRPGARGGGTPGASRGPERRRVGVTPGDALFAVGETSAIPETSDPRAVALASPGRTKPIALSYMAVGHYEDGENSDLWWVDKAGKLHQRKVDGERDRHALHASGDDRRLWGRIDHKYKLISLATHPDRPASIHHARYVARQLREKHPGYTIQEFNRTPLGVGDSDAMFATGSTPAFSVDGQPGTPENDQRDQQFLDDIRRQLKSQFGVDTPVKWVAGPGPDGPRRVGDVSPAGAAGGRNDVDSRHESDRRGVEALGEFLGRPVRWFTAHPAVRGFRKPGYIAVNADSPIAHLAVFGHEFLHDIEANAPDLHAPLVAAVRALNPRPSTRRRLWGRIDHKHKLISLATHPERTGGGGKPGAAARSRACGRGTLTNRIPCNCDCRPHQ